MSKKDLIIIADYTAQSQLTLKELCEACRVSEEIINNLIEFEIVSPPASNADERTFNLIELKRVQRALRLRRDLNVNLEGIGVLLDLIEQLEQLKQQLHFFEKQFNQPK
ncbi:MAG: MerR family transcriptional regulator [Gammaproteobacteria bacterium]|nr:MerR family transcriptional regulator [Gammaproteobacteria bacterium]